MMNLNKDTIECATFPTAESEFLKAMDAHRQGDEPFASAEMGELMRRTDEVLKRLSLEDGAKLRELSAGWRELVLAGYALSCGYAPHTADGVGELFTVAPEGAAWRAENLRLTRAAEAWRTPCRKSCPSVTAGTTSAPWHWFWASGGEHPALTFP